MNNVLISLVQKYFHSLFSPFTFCGCRTQPGMKSRSCGGTSTRTFSVRFKSSFFSFICGHQQIAQFACKRSSPQHRDVYERVIYLLLLFSCLFLEEASQFRDRCFLLKSNRSCLHVSAYDIGGRDDEEEKKSE